MFSLVLQPIFFVIFAQNQRCSSDYDNRSTFLIFTQNKQDLLLIMITYLLPLALLKKLSSYSADYENVSFTVTFLKKYEYPVFTMVCFSVLYLYSQSPSISTSLWLFLQVTSFATKTTFWSLCRAV